MNKELKPCPFCGGETKISYRSDKVPTVCNCDVEMAMYFGIGAAAKSDALEALTKAWNTRA